MAQGIRNRSHLGSLPTPYMFDKIKEKAIKFLSGVIFVLLFFFVNSRTCDRNSAVSLLVVSTANDIFVAGRNEHKDYVQV
jgi:hypothetical protein